MKKFIIGTSVLALLIGIFAVLCADGYAEKNYGKLPRITGKSFSGAAADTDSYKGKVIIVDVWASWCPPCRKEIPGFISLQKKYGSKGLQVLGVSCDRSEKEHASYAESVKMNYPSVSASQAGAALDKLEKQIGKIEGIPTTVIVNRKGDIVYVHVGYAEEEEFEKIIKKYL